MFVVSGGVKEKCLGEWFGASVVVRDNWERGVIFLGFWWYECPGGASVFRKGCVVVSGVGSGRGRDVG